MIDVFVDELDLSALGFEGIHPEATGRVAGKAISRLSFMLMRPERRDYLFRLRYKGR